MIKFRILFTLFSILPYLSICQPLAGTDELGRILPQNSQVGDVNPNRKVGIFYFLWQGDKGSKTSEHYWDLSEIIPNHPEVLENFTDPHWGTTSMGGIIFGENQFTDTIKVMIIGFT